MAMPNPFPGAPGDPNAGTGAPSTGQPAIKLFRSNRDREELERAGALYAIIVALDALEEAYISDMISDRDYSSTCRQLLSQYQVARQVVAGLEDGMPGVRNFCQQYGLECRAALIRLEAGIPAGVAVSSGKSFTHAINVGKDIVTLNDYLDLQMRSTDNVLPLLNQILGHLEGIEHLPVNFQGKAVIRNWIGQIHNRPAYEELADHEVRQLRFDLSQLSHSLNSVQ
ncbi:hypothetical protein H696_04944 [Fonticula alba]|uniref:Vacuolar protein sorting-associated protein 28 homolog n=1 Tax=Fonticula alba TaxID=691883 RepID=A0A058Z3Z8_FONAL|nr:hypothetical protein H696_04944 [Fonticula alba]KCV68653.1 hypothetical protein H696_04944 [Fonticula alba]|eukprot:XP_009497085.1 hypothetical protein H696_04944 [Fonticula alba]